MKHLTSKKSMTKTAIWWNYVENVSWSCDGCSYGKSKNRLTSDQMNMFGTPRDRDIYFEHLVHSNAHILDVLSILRYVY